MAANKKSSRKDNLPEIKKGLPEAELSDVEVARYFVRKAGKDERFAAHAAQLDETHVPKDAGAISLCIYLQIAQGVHLALYGTPLFKGETKVGEFCFVYPQVRSKILDLREKEQWVHVSKENAAFMDDICALLQNVKHEQLIMMARYDVVWRDANGTKKQDPNKYSNKNFEEFIIGHAKSYERQYRDTCRFLRIVEHNTRTEIQPGDILNLELPGDKKQYRYLVIGKDDTNKVAKVAKTYSLVGNEYLAVAPNYYIFSLTGEGKGTSISNFLAVYTQNVKTIELCPALLAKNILRWSIPRHELELVLSAIKNKEKKFAKEVSQMKNDAISQIVIMSLNSVN